MWYNEGLTPPGSASPISQKSARACLESRPPYDEMAS